MLRIAGLSAASFIFNIKLTNGIINNIRRIVIRLAQFNFIPYTLCHCQRSESNLILQLSIINYQLHASPTIDAQYLPGYVIILE